MLTASRSVPEAPVIPSVKVFLFRDASVFRVRLVTLHCSVFCSFFLSLLVVHKEVCLFTANFRSRFELKVLREGQTEKKFWTVLKKFLITVPIPRHLRDLDKKYEI